MSAYLERLTGNDYRDAFARILPRGVIWTITDVLGGIALTLQGLGIELARAHNRLLDVLEEADPRTTTELIDAWERVLGLPEPTDPSPPTTLADRRAVVHAKFIARGGSQPAILADVIAAAGYTDTVIELPTLFRSDESASDERAYDDEWVWYWFVWRLTTPTQGWARLQAVLDAIKPAHTVASLIDGLHADEVTLPT